MHEDWRRLTHEVLVRVYYKEDGQTGHGNSEFEYSSWLENSDVSDFTTSGCCEIPILHC
jgi:hypothetical protein